jgi:hypothetical protein
MPNINDAFPSKYLRASDLRGTQPIVTIDHVNFEEVGRTKDRKLVVYFVGKEKGLVCNKTNGTKIAQLLGESDTDNWHGGKIRLYSTEVEFSGDTVEAIRVKAAGNGAAQQRLAPPPPPEDAGEPAFDDEIPF